VRRELGRHAIASNLSVVPCGKAPSPLRPVWIGSGSKAPPNPSGHGATYWPFRAVPKAAHGFFDRLIIGALDGRLNRPHQSEPRAIKRRLKPYQRLATPRPHPRVSPSQKTKAAPEKSRPDHPFPMRLNERHWHQTPCRTTPHMPPAPFPSAGPQRHISFRQIQTRHVSALCMHEGPQPPTSGLCRLISPLSRFSFLPSAGFF